MSRWNDGFRSDPDLARKVRGSLPTEQAKFAKPSTVAVWIGNAFSRPGLAACFAAVFILVGMGLSQLLMGGYRGSGDEVTLSYRLSIDPIYRLQAMAGANQFGSREIQPADYNTVDAPVLSAGLGWLQGALDLTAPQYKKVTALHSDYEMAFDDLFSELVESHREYQEFDRKRMKNDVVDYFQLYELLQTQKKLSEESARLTEELLSKVEQVIDPSQRVRYRKLLDQIYPRSSVEGERGTDA